MAPTMTTDLETALDTAHQTINDQEEAICELNHKLLAMEDARDMALGKALEAVASLKRVECSESLWDAQEIARKAIDSFQGK